MRIAQIATLARPVPPEGEGSIESLVHVLTEGLIKRGHDVTLFALPESNSHAKLRSPVRESYRSGAEMWDWQVYEAFNAREAFLHAAEFDVIHCHSYHFGLMFCDFIKTPSIHSIHLEPGPDIRFLAQRTKNRRIVFTSQYQARDFSDIDGIEIIPHGISGFEPESIGWSERGNYLVWLGRFVPEKGPLEAIQIAKQTNMTLKLAGPPNPYYEMAVKPHVDGNKVQYLGEVAGDEKFRLLCGARALIYPVQWGEPFGLVIAESMLCGTPVLGLNIGSVPELVTHGVTGFIGKTNSDLVRFSGQIDSLDRAEIARRARETFAVDRMVDRFEKLMQKIVKEGQ